MKKNIHPKYYSEAKIICACGAEYIVGSTVPEMHVEICAACHPFFTGKQKLIDTAGRVDKFKKKLEKSKEVKKTKRGKKKAKKKVKS